MFTEIIWDSKSRILTVDEFLKLEQSDKEPFRVCIFELRNRGLLEKNGDYFETDEFITINRCIEHRPKDNGYYLKMKRK